MSILIKIFMHLIYAIMEPCNKALLYLPVYSSLLQVSLIVAMFAVFPNQLVGVGLVRDILGYQGDAYTQGTAVVVHLPGREGKHVSD